MKTIQFKRQLIIALHLLFWIVSFNLFNSFFSRGVESGYVLNGMDLTWLDLLWITNLILFVVLTPFIWFVKGINIRLKRWVTALNLILILAGAYLSFFPSGTDLLIPVLLIYFLSNFLYVLIFHLTIVVAVYINIRFLITRYLSKGRIWVYLVNTLGLAIVAGILNYALFDLFIDLIFPQMFFLSWFTVPELILIMMVYLTITTVIILLVKYWQMIIDNREKVQHELSALKAQINPHFLFNNLNTIYALASRGDQRTKDVILQLSDFLRYVLYDTSSEKIQLEKEIEIIKTYVGLQKERINPDVTEIILNITGDFSGALIAPLLLLPLAENCFKHGVGKNKGTILIEIAYSNHELHFITKNPVARREDPVNNEQGKIGIKNVEKRLNLLYPGKHLLSFDENGDTFSVDLKLNLSDNNGH